MIPTYSTDFVIFGGGIAGLWLLNRLRSEGYQAVLLESRSLGSGQTCASQGIIHGGLKYALSGSIGGATKAIAQMPDRWRRCLAGTGDVDLRGTRLLSEHYYMWSESGLRSKLKTYLGSKSLRGSVEAVNADDYPVFFKQSSVDGILYRLPDFVIDTQSLLAALASRQRDCLFKIEADSASFDRDASGGVDSVSLLRGNQALSGHFGNLWSRPWSPGSSYVPRPAGPTIQTIPTPTCSPSPRSAGRPPKRLSR